MAREDSDSVDHTLADAFGNLKIDEIGDVWIKRVYCTVYTEISCMVKAA